MCIRLALLGILLAAGCGAVESARPDSNVGDDGPPDASAGGCGDSVIGAGETCDDGLTAAGDGCSATCAVEPFYRCTGAPSTCHKVNILYAPTGSDDAAFRSTIGSFTGGTVVYFDATTATPALADLAIYDCVYTYVLSSYADNVGFGNLMADFVDAGGVAVLGGFTSFTQGSFLAGRIMTDAYSPAANPTGTNHYAVAAYAGDGTTGIHDGVTAYGSQYRDTLAVQGAGVVDGTYADGEIAHAYRPDFHVIYSNGIGDLADGSATGDWARLIANSCSVAYSAPP